jgi:hypothetical protein
VHVGKIEPIEYVPGGQGVQDRDPAREVDPIGQEVQFLIEPLGKFHVPSAADRVRDTVGPKAPAEQFQM